MGNLLKNSKITKGALFIYWTVLTYLLLKPAELQKEAWFIFPNIDKLVHLSIFGLLAFIFLIAYKQIKFFVFIQIMMLYAFLTEIFQELMKMGRSMETLDILADLTGVCIAYYIYSITIQKHNFN